MPKFQDSHRLIQAFVNMVGRNKPSKVRWALICLLSIALGFLLVVDTFIPRAVDTKRTLVKLIDAYPAAERPRLVEMPGYTLYIPANIPARDRVPLVVALSPGADPYEMLLTWQKVADRRKWIVFGSKIARNGVPFTQTLPPVITGVRSVIATYPIDSARIIATGISGGAMSSHRLAAFYPDLFKAIVLNTGMMAEDQVAGSIRIAHGKIAVFLASSTDFRYQEMKRDRSLLVSRGWKTKWIEFSGGHTFAPDSAYQEASEWLSVQLALH